MRHFALRLAVALLAFFVGVTAASLWGFKRAVILDRNPEPAAMPLSVPTEVIVSGGILNGRAVSKPAPVYPQIALAARARGMVAVHVVVDENGDVTSATAISGHPLLQQSAVAAARQAKFPPTRLSGEPVKVSGVLTYDFGID